MKVTADSKKDPKIVYTVLDFKLPIFLPNKLKKWLDAVCLIAAITTKKVTMEKNCNFIDFPKMKKQENSGVKLYGK